MSRVGKKPIEIPAGVTVTIGLTTLLLLKVQKVNLTRTFNPDIKIKVEENVVNINTSF